MYNPQEIEKEVQDFWRKEKVPEKVTKFDSKKKKFFLLDGPPYINYVPHVGHVKTTTFKDVWGKFKTMQGHSVWYQPGFDCSGLPIENAVEKKLGITSKRDIEKMGVGKFIGECKKLAEKNLPVWLDIYKKLGAWRGWLEPYMTYKNHFLESGWWSVKQMYERGLLVEGNKSGYWCSHCETVLAGYEVTDSYKQVTDPSIFVKFPVRGEKNTFFLVWTTTPWTLPSNVAIAVHPNENYVKVEVSGEKLILAEKRLSALEELEIGYKVLEKIPGKKLEGMKYNGVVDTPLQKEMDKKFHYIILSIKLLKKRSASKVGEGEDVFEDFVTMDTGTGLVHSAPGLGDHKIGEHYNLAFLSPIDDHGNFTEGAGKYKGLYVKKADKVIIEDLESNGLLLYSGQTTHSYPLCWRCKTPLIYRMSEQWFVKLDTLREKMIKDSKKVKWLPGFGKDRFHEVLTTAPDWAVTRQRYWGIPLPIWVCSSCKSKKVIGSVKELRESSVKQMPKDVDLHKDVVDNIQLKCHCSGSMVRVKHIMDVWFDSGITPWASLGYPFKNKELFEKLWTVDLIDESQDQTRGWFYTLMLCGQSVWGKTPYRTVCLNGWVLDRKGDKMSKSLGNVVWATDGYKELGSDLLRLYYCSEVAPWDTQKFSIRAAKDLERVLNVLWNTSLFVQTYGSDAKARQLEPEDEWIVSRLNSLVKNVTNHYETFYFHMVGRELVEFLLNDFSRWYIKLVRDRVSPFYKGSDKESAQWTMRHVLETAVKLLAPVCPFISEKIYKDLTGNSVHLSRFPREDKKKINPKLEEKMEAVKQMMEVLNALRQDKKIKLRWPVDKIFVQSNLELKELEGVINRMGNTKEVVFVSKVTGKAKEFPGGSIAIGSVIKEEALVRELIRKVQSLRKKAGLRVNEQIQLTLETDPKTEKLLKRFEQDIVSGTGSSRVTFDKQKPRGSLEFDNRKISISF